MKILLIDDDPDFRDFAKVALEESGIEFESADDAEAGLSRLGEGTGGEFDLILLDVEMPGRSGWDLVTDLRERGNEIPVIFVTGRESVDEKVKGLKLGADDYVVKPIEFEELIARIEAVVRRRRSLAPTEFGDLKLDLSKRKVRRGGAAVHLSPREYDLLLALVQANGDLITREALLEDVWDMRFDPGTNLLDVHIGRLRRKLDKHGRPAIQTVRGKGFRLVRHETVAE